LSGLFTESAIKEDKILFYLIMFLCVSGVTGPFVASTGFKPELILITISGLFYAYIFLYIVKIQIFNIKNKRLYIQSKNKNFTLYGLVSPNNVKTIIIYLLMPLPVALFIGASISGAYSLSYILHLIIRINI